MPTPDTAGLEESRRDIRAAARKLGISEAKYLVQSYYQVQEYRKASGNMTTALTKDGKPCDLVNWISRSQKRIEEDIKAGLAAFALADPTGEWALSNHGIGPVITAGLLAHIDITKAPTVGHVWSFAGLNPAVKWLKGQKRPWNADLKVLCYKIGDSFVKSSGNDKSFYGPIYRHRKEQEVARNEAGAYAQIAAETLATIKIQEPTTKAAYESGKLPAGRIDMRARRIAVKLFLSHFHDVMMWYQLSKRAPIPYAFAHLGHAHPIDCPNPPWV